MTPADVKAIVSETVRETLLSLGVDTSDPLAVQRDFAALREWRQSIEAVRAKGIVALVGIVFAGGAALLWAGFKVKLGG